MRGDIKLKQEVAEIGDLSREELVERWVKAYGCLPPSGVRRELLIRSAAWHLQTRRIGGFSSETRRRLREAVRRLEDEISRKVGVRSEENNPTAVASERGVVEFHRSCRKRQYLSSGARLLREWNGRTHVVDVIDGGFVFEAKVYSSLSAIARQITGMQWSGPRFFGL